MVLVATGRNLDMREVLKHTLGSVPWALSNCDGTLKKTKESFTLLQEFVCKTYASQTSLCKVSDLRYQLFKVKKGDVDSNQLPPCQDTLML